MCQTGALPFKAVDGVPKLSSDYEDRLLIRRSRVGSEPWSSHFDGGEVLQKPVLYDVSAR